MKCIAAVDENWGIGKNGGLLLRVPADMKPQEMEKLALAQPKVVELTAGKTIVKVICVPKKLVNIVVK